MAVAGEAERRGTVTSGPGAIVAQRVERRVETETRAPDVQRLAGLAAERCMRRNMESPTSEARLSRLRCSRKASREISFAALHGGVLARDGGGKASRS